MDQFDRQGDTDNMDFANDKNGFWAGDERHADLAISDLAEVSQQALTGHAIAPDDANKGEAKMVYPRAGSPEEDEEMSQDMVSSEEAGEEELPAVSRKVRRRRKRSRPRSKTIAMKRLTREELRVGALMYPPVDDPRPETRAQCMNESGPCPWVACKHHLYLDVNPETGSIKINFPDLEPWDLKQTCALAVADRGGITLEEVGEIMNLTRERIRQVEVRGLRKIRASSPSPEELGADLSNHED